MINQSGAPDGKAKKGRKGASNTFETLKEDKKGSHWSDAKKILNCKVKVKEHCV
jgi:hypothetical protein